MNEKILIIEDESALQKTLGELFKREGYTIFNALNGEIGLSSAKKEKPDLILLDLILPKMNGFEVLESLKTEEETKNIPVIILTNLERNEDVDKALGLGATTYLIKANYDIKDVLEKVRNTLSK